MDNPWCSPSNLNTWVVMISGEGLYQCSLSRWVGHTAPEGQPGPIEWSPRSFKADHCQQALPSAGHPSSNAGHWFRRELAQLPEPNEAIWSGPMYPLYHPNPAPNPGPIPPTRGHCAGGGQRLWSVRGEIEAEVKVILEVMNRFIRGVTWCRLGEPWEGELLRSGGAFVSRR